MGGWYHEEADGRPVWAAGTAVKAAGEAVAEKGVFIFFAVLGFIADFVGLACGCQDPAHAEKLRQ